MIVSIIVACGKNKELGLNNKLLWCLPEDLKNFKSLTLNHHIIMGRKTFESIGKPLPNRTSVVITRNKDWKSKGVLVAKDVQDAIRIAKKNGETEAFICGGGQIYEEVLKNDLADRLYITKVDWEGEADTFLPNIEKSKWVSTHSRVCGITENNPCSWEFTIFERKNNL